MDENKLTNAFLRAINKFSDEHRDMLVSQDQAWELAQKLVKITKLTKNKNEQ